MPPKTVRLTGAQLLRYLHLDAAGVVAVRSPLPANSLKVGDAVPIIYHDPDPPTYLLLGVEYPAVALIKALRDQDPSKIDAYRMGATKKVRVSERDKLIFQLASEGRTYAEIGAIAGGVKRQRVKQILDKLKAVGFGTVDTASIRQQAREALIAEAKDAYVHDWARTPDERMQKVLKNIHHKCGRSGIPCTIKAEDLRPLPTHCPALGIELDYTSTPGNRDAYASVDRITPSIGYVPGNVVVVSVRANRIKNDATVDELRRIATFYSKINRPDT